MTTCTIFVMACLSWPCFFERRRTWSFRRLQSPLSLLIVTMATRTLEVVERSEAYTLYTNKHSLTHEEQWLSHLSRLLLQS